MSTKTPKKKIAIFTTPQGHLSIAEAIQEKIEALSEDNYSVSQFFARPALMKEYSMIYKYVPFVFVVPYKLTKFDKVSDFFGNLSKRKFIKKITEFIDKEQPDLCISTNFVFNTSLEAVCNKRAIPLLNVLANPGLVHPLELSREGDYNLTIDDETTKLLQTQYPGVSFATTGWFVRTSFEKEYSQQAVRQQLGIDPKVFHLLLVSGSEGAQSVLKILPSLIGIKKQVVITVACGKNKLFFDQVEMMARVIHKLSSNITITPLPFTKDIHEYMQSADLIAGKAGPNTLFEAIATNTPFFAMMHVSGHEDVNLSIIREHKIGFVEEGIIGASKLLIKIINHPEQLKSYQERVAQLSTYNKESGKRLLQLIDTMIKKRKK